MNQKEFEAPETEFKISIKNSNDRIAPAHKYLGGIYWRNKLYLGDFTGPLTRIQDNQGNFGSTAVIVGANGKDTVFLTVNGRFEPSKDKCLVTSTGTYIVTGGSGAFANATGSGTIDTQIDLCANTAKGTYTGTISKPNSN